jgi:hypothetical protein
LAFGVMLAVANESRAYNCFSQTAPRQTVNVFGAKLGFDNPKSGILQAFPFQMRAQFISINTLLGTAYIR